MVTNNMQQILANARNTPIVVTPPRRDLGITTNTPTQPQQPQDVSPLPAEPGSQNYMIQQLSNGSILAQQGSKVAPITNSANQVIGYNITPPTPVPEPLDLSGIGQNQNDTAMLDQTKQQELTNEYAQQYPQIGG